MVLYLSMKLKDMTAIQMNSGSYMNKYRVRDYIQDTYLYSLYDIVRQLPEHVSLGGVFYSTDDLRNIIPADAFREMECHVVTYSLSYPENN